MAKRTESELEQCHLKLVKLTDELIFKFMEALAESDTPINLILERMLTACAAHTVGEAGVHHAAKTFRAVALDIEAGAFMHIDPLEKGTKH